MDHNIILLIVAILGVILITLLLSKNDVNKVSTLLLATFYFIFTVYSIQTYVIETGLLKKMPWFYGWPLVLYSLFSVPIYFYFISICKDSFKWKWKYLIIFIPFLLSSIDVIILYLKPASFYNEILEKASLNSENRFEVSYGLFSLNKHYFIRHLWQFIFLVSLFPMLKRFVNFKSTEKLKKILDRWLIFLFTSLTIMAFLSTLFGIDEMIKMNLFQYVFNTSLAKPLFIYLFYAVVLGIGIAPIYFPSILYGFPQVLTPVTLVKTKINSDKIEDVKYGLDEVKIKSKLKLIEEKKLYLLQDFDLTMCAKELNLPYHHLSYFLNQNFGISFASYRNNLRMDKAISLIKEGFLDGKTIQALSRTCGFASRSSFSKTFKNYTSFRLKEYSQKINQGAF